MHRLRRHRREGGCAGAARGRERRTSRVHSPVSSSTWRTARAATERAWSAAPSSDKCISATCDATVASNVQAALRSLPNQVLDGVSVKATLSDPTVCHRAADGVQHIAAHTSEHSGWHTDGRQSANGCKADLANGAWTAAVDEIVGTPGKTAGSSALAAAFTSSLRR